MRLGMTLWWVGDSVRVLRCFFNSPCIRSTSDSTLETDIPQHKGGAKKPRPICLECSLRRSSICLPETKCVWSISTNQLIFHGLPSNIHSFRISYLNRWKREFIWLRLNIHPHNSMRLHWKERQLAVKEFTGRLLSFESMSQKRLQLSETQLRHHWLAQKSSEIWSVKESSDLRSDARPDSDWVRFEPAQSLSEL